MTQALFDALSGGVSNLENQSAIQSILETQHIVEASPAVVDEDDIFQCGKCKKQFTSLQAFVTHKHGQCTPIPIRPCNQTLATIPGLNSNPLNSAFTTHRPQQSQPSGLQLSSVPQLNSVPQLSSMPQLSTISQLSSVAQLSTVPASPLTQVTQNLVLTDEQMLALTGGLEQTVQNGLLHGSTLQLTGNTVQATGPFLSQLTPQGTNGVTIISPVQTTTAIAPSTGQVYTSTGSLNNIPSVVHQTGHQVISTIPDKQAPVQHIIKPSPTKAARKSAQANAAESGSLTRTRRGRLGTSLTDEYGRKKLVCSYCHKSFSKNFDLAQHVRAHTGERPFQCVVCGRAFAQKSNVKKHMATHKVWPTGTGSCLPLQPPALLVPVEGEAGSQVDIVPLAPGQQPQLSEQPPPPVQPSNPAPMSPTTIADPAVNATNYKLKVVIDNSYLCHYCPEKFKSYFSLKTHMMRHKSEQVYKCVVKTCAATFMDLDEFLEHTTSHQGEMSYRCHQCNKTFASLYELGVHQYTHSIYQAGAPKTGPRHFQCNKCLNKYSTPEALEHHMTTTEHKFPCPHCEKNFACERFLRRHLACHGTENQWPCDVCSKKFKTEHYLKMHLLIHSGETPYRCDECGAAFNRKDKLKRHAIIHDKRIRFKCPFKNVTGCEKEFNRPDKLKAHIISHSGVRPYSCQYCGKEFSRRPHLREHERGHRADYPYTCPSCHKGFFRPKQVKDHKCVAPMDGEPPRRRKFQPRHNRRKPGRPRKWHKPEEDGMAAKTVTMVTRKAAKAAEAQKVVAQQKQAMKAEIIEKDMGITTVDGGEGAVDTVAENMISDGMIVAGSGFIDNSVVTEDHGSQKQVKRTKPECYVQTPPASVVEHFVTVHLTNSEDGDGSQIQAHIIPNASGAPYELTSSGTHLQISASCASAFQPITIVEGQPVELSAAQQQQLNSFALSNADVIDIPVDIVTVSDDQAALMCSQVVNAGGDVTPGSGLGDTPIPDYTGDGDNVLRGSENLINSTVEITTEKMTKLTQNTDPGPPAYSYSGKLESNHFADGS